MKEQDRKERTKQSEPRKPRDPSERTVGPPIEREHETQKGIFEEDEKRKEHERTD